MSETYAFGQVTEELLVALHQIVAPETPQDPFDGKLELIVDSDASGYAFTGLDERNPVHVGLFFARMVIDIHAFDEGNKRTATALFKYIVTMSGGNWGVSIGALPDLINMLYDIPTDKFIDFANNWPNGFTD